MKSITSLLTAHVTLCVTAVFAVEVPPGYRLVELSEPGTLNRLPAINNRGDIAWHVGFDPSDLTTYEIALYSARDEEVRYITSNQSFDGNVDINDAGEVVWQRLNHGLNVHDIVLWREGIETYVTNEAASVAPRDNFSTAISNHGQVVWAKRTTPVCSTTDGELWLWDGVAARQLTNIGLSNQSPVINSSGAIVWTNYYFCPSPWTSRIMLLEEGAPEAVSANLRWPQKPDITDAGVVIFTHRPEDVPGGAVEALTPNGLERVITDCLNAAISDDGRFMACNRWIQADDSYEVMVQASGLLSQLTSDPAWDIDPDVNNRGEVVWQNGDSPYMQIRAILRYESGDTNCDGRVGNGDIGPFVLSLIDPLAFQLQYPHCALFVSDLNEDGFVTVADIGPFIKRLLTQ